VTPADVAAEIEQQACQFHREATGQLTLASVISAMRPREESTSASHCQNSEMNSGGKV
jgi:hypothetical protein